MAHSDIFKLLQEAMSEMGDGTTKSLEATRGVTVTVAARMDYSILTMRVQNYSIKESMTTQTLL